MLGATLTCPASPQAAESLPTDPCPCPVDVRREAGYRVTKATGSKARWHVQWGGLLDGDEYGRLHEFQRVNHFPGASSLYESCAMLRPIIVIVMLT